MTGLRLIGGEMPAWSDDRPGERPPVRGVVLTHLLDQVHRTLPTDGRVLIAGPHHTDLIDALPRARVTCLVRSLPDATALAHRGLDVLCGTLAKITDVDRYDVVVALDGLDRLCSVEGPQYDWADSLRTLGRALKPGGAMVLAVHNELGVHRLVARRAVTSAHTDGAWHPVGEFDVSRPASPARLTGQLAAEGITVHRLWAAWPVPESPAVLATPAAVNEPDGPGGALAAAVSAAVAAAYWAPPVLTDPRRLAATAVRSGLGAELAASWLVVAHRTPEPSPAPTLPEVLLGHPVHGPVQELCRAPDRRWHRRTLGAPATGRPAAAVTHRPSSSDGPVPAGRLLEELLLTACLQHDLPAVRRLLTGYVGWLSGLPGGHAFATFDNVLLDDGTHALFDSGWDTTWPVDPTVAAVRALRRFAMLLTAGGYAHPWPAAPDVDALTAVLAGAAGLEVDPDGLARAAALHAWIAPVRHDRSPPRPGATMIAPDSWRQSEELIQRLRGDLADAAARAEWHESELSHRTAELRRAHLQIAMFSGSPGYRLARLGIAVARRAVRLARRIRQHAPR